MIEKNKIEEIKHQTDIVALISQYVQLKKVGKNYRALCPFHTEKDPSFYVIPDKGIYHCFGCKKGGNAITFLMEYEKLDFPSAVRRLAKDLGIEIDTSHGLKHREFYDVNDKAAQFFTLCLNREIGKRGRSYLAERSLDLTRCKDFRLGYAPASGGLVTYMRQKGIKQESLIKVGLVAQHSTGRSIREIFRDRIMFPIFNLSGRIIGFGGRSLDDNVQPKYLNSPETPIFKKGEGLYGLYQARDFARQKQEILLVEGYFDLLNLYQHGLNYVCAPLGTSLTEKQAILLSRFAKKVYVLFDGDLSGIKAALRAIGLLISAQIDVYIASLPDGSDPDTVIKDQGVDALRGIVESADDFFHFYRKHVNTDTVEQEVAVIKDLIEIVSNIHDEIRFDRYVKYAAHVFDIGADVILRHMKGKVQETPRTSLRSKKTPEEILMAMILNHKEYFPGAAEILDTDDFMDPALARLFQTLRKDESFDVSDLSDVDIIDEGLKERLMALIIMEPTVSYEEFKKAVVHYKSEVETRRIKEKIAAAHAKGDVQAVMQYNEQLNVLKKKVLQLKTENVTHDVGSTG
ncbi:DNA primase [candidate division WOR-3 bacterium]|nr:DNA primase [candidate division WOR-3 bacterium]